MAPHDDTGAGGGEEGMMLAEVLVGLAILSLVTLAMLRVFSGTTMAVDRVERIRDRLSVAEDVLSERVADVPVRVGREAGHRDGLDWWLDAVQVDMPGAAVPAYAIHIRVGNSAGPPVLSSVVYGKEP
ncbi:type II secretion system protein [Rhizobium sp. NFR03]|uniref:PulJ/GspJ family protein n=1 Tax=Rhizobium sp. NFR03 TaxID=1566263 RepID=UPI0008B52BE4|nr:type II secretion system protein [Rhizobium sp. NFR03]SES28367.1 hypothetical protein SAMN03159406_03241 [Rhizobium sp. NFR03]